MFAHHVIRIISAIYNDLTRTNPIGACANTPNIIHIHSEIEQNLLLRNENISLLNFSRPSLFDSVLFAQTRPLFALLFLVHGSISVQSRCALPANGPYYHRHTHITQNTLGSCPARANKGAGAPRLNYCANKLYIMRQRQLKTQTGSALMLCFALSSLYFTSTISLF